MTDEIKSTYVILPTNEITDEMVEASITDESSIRKSLDGSKAILKFDSKFPSVMQGYDKYSHSEILEVIKGPEWALE